MPLTTFKGFGLTEPQTVATAETLAGFVLPGDRPLPPSYRDYAQHLGYGLLCGLFLVYIPMGTHCDSVTVRSEVLAAVNREAVEEDFMEYEPDGSPALVLRLFPFAVSENGDVLAWDLEDDENGEYTIYRIGPRAGGVNRAGRSLFEVLESLLDDRVKTVLGPGYEPLQPTFEPDVPA